jgi:hypothetical protein
LLGVPLDPTIRVEATNDAIGLGEEFAAVFDKGTDFAN